MANNKVKPNLMHTILCDDVRQELGGKFSLMGLFETISAGTFPALHARFAILNEWSGGRGEFIAKIRLLMPDRKTVLSESDGGRENNARSHGKSGDVTMARDAIASSGDARRARNASAKFETFAAPVSTVPLRGGRCENQFYDRIVRDAAILDGDRPLEDRRDACRHGPDSSTSSGDSR
jgi:hypothetical protein